MVELTILLAAFGLLSMGAVLALRYANSQRWQQELVAHELRFPRRVDAAAVTAFISAVSGIVAPRWKRSFVTRGVVLETTADKSGIAHHLLLPRSRAAVVLAALRAALPSVIVQPDLAYRATQPCLAAELGLSDQWRQLKVSQAETISRTLLANLQPLKRGERLVVQWVISPIGPVELIPDGDDPEADKAARIKQAMPLFLASGRVGVVARSEKRARGLMIRVLAAFHLANAPGVHLRRRALPSRMVAAAVAARRVPLVVTPSLLNSAELAALVGFPLGEVSLPGLRLGGTRQLAPATDIPSGGRMVARATFPGSERSLALSVTDSLRHLHVIGPTGVGKSTLLLSLISQDMAAGRGVVVLDPKGDLVVDVLDRVPASRVPDVVVLDPTDEERPVGFNLFTGGPARPS